MTEIEALQAKVDELTAENRALKQEIKVCNGNMRCAIHNAEIAKVKAESMKAEYERRLKEQPDDFWRREVKLASDSRDFWKREYDKLDKCLRDAVTHLKGRGKYTVIEAGE